MAKHEEKRAKKLERLLKKGGVCHDSVVDALQETSKSLSSLSQAEASGMDPDVMAKQRAMLMSKSKELKSSSAASVEKKRSAVSFGEAFARAAYSLRKAIVPLSTAVLVTAVIVTLVIPRGTLLHQAEIGRRITDLIIPAAMAADAFAFQSEIEDAAGASTGTAFIIRSKMDLSAEALSSHIVIVPSRKDADRNPDAAVSVNVEKKGTDTFRVTPKALLDPGTVYRVEIRAAVQSDDGNLQARTFSWAIQTKNVFRVLSSVPGDESNTVPVNTVVEVTVNMDRWSDPASHFRMAPEVKGSFKTKGRTVIFVPDQPLQYGTVYTATWSKDWGVKDSDVALGNDYSVRFETVSKVQAEADAKKYDRVSVSNPYVAMAPGKSLMVPVYAYSSNRQPEVVLEGYSLSRDRAAAYLAEDAKRPSFGVADREAGTLETSFAKTLSFTASTTVSQVHGFDVVSVPNTINQGYYLVKLSLPGSSSAHSSWMFLNVTDEAAYLIADKDQTIVWVMHATQERPLEGITVSDGKQTAKTDKDGIAKLKTSDETSKIIRIGEGDHGTLLSLSGSMNLRTSYWWWNESTNDSVDRTVSYLHVDRPLYHPTDSVEFSGLVQDREGGKSVSEPVTVSLMRSCSLWSCDEERGIAKLFERTSVTADDRGFFQGKLSWESLGEGAYTVVLKRGDSVIRSENVEIRNFAKPDYTVDATVEKNEVFAGEKIKGAVHATFFEGTPMANLKLSINSQDGNLEQVTDEDGSVQFAFDAQNPNCDIERNPESACYNATRFSINVSPIESEASSDISDYESVMVWNSDIDLVPDWRTKFEGRTATVSVRADRVELPTKERVERKTISNLQIHAVVVEHWWERIQTSTGYDEIEKKTYPIYRYDEHKETIAKLDQQTDVKGTASFSFQTKEDRTYDVVMYAKDSKGRWSVTRNSVYPCPSCSRNASADSSEVETAYITFGPTEDRRENWAYHLGEKVSLGLKADEIPLSRTSAPTYLFVTARLGIKNVKVSVDPMIEFSFEESLAPNVRVYAVAFRKGGFREYTTDAYMNTDDRKLTVDISLDHQTYAPGSDATIRVSVKDPSGKPKEGARVSLAVVDEALFKVANYSVNENALGALYTGVGSGVTFSAKTHRSDEEGFGNGGAEMGGGGGDGVRKNFKDTAAYQLVTTDRNGEGQVKIKLPDNLTTWRVSGIGMTADRYAGNSQASIVVTKNVFVNAVLPEVFLASDKPQMKLRAYGTSLKTGDGVTFDVDAPTLGINRQKIGAKVGESAYLTIDRPVAGEHVMTIRLQSAAGTDAIEKKVMVLDSRFYRDEGVRTDVVTGAQIDIGGASDVRLSFVPKTRAQYLPALYQLRWDWSQRVEGMIAKRVAGELLKRDFGEQIEDGEASLLMHYQRPDGGIAILPHASSDIVLSSRVAYTYPQGFDRDRLADFFRNQLRATDAPREVQVEAISGLAAIGEPVLLDLRSIAALNDLSWREQISVMRGLAAIGDLEAARPFFNKLLEGREIKDDAMTAHVSDSDVDNQEATTQLAAIAIRLGDSRANALSAGIKTIWDGGTYMPLAKADFLNVAVPSALGNIASVTYEVNGKKTKVELKEGWPQTVDLIAKEAESFKVVDVSGPVEMTYLKRVTSKPQQDSRITLKRTYLQGGKPSGNTLKDGGDSMTVELVPEFAADAPKGCYAIQDHVPAGFSVMTGWRYWEDGMAYISPFESQNPTFVICTNWKDRTIRYRVKPTARGSYLAEPAAIQSMDHPSVTSLSGEQRVVVE